MTNLILVRHGQSEWNEKNLFTGWKDPDLSAKGIQEAKQAGQIIKQARLSPSISYTSALRRAQHTLDLILEVIGMKNMPIIQDQALNERDYGDLSGKNKDEARAKFGEEQVQIWRRSYDVRPPGGESLKDTEARAWPYFQREILPRLKKSEVVLIAAHGNSLRSIIKNLDNLTGDQIVGVEIATGVPIFYQIDKNGRATEKRIMDAA